jgi:hypothetical protein
LTLALDSELSASRPGCYTDWDIPAPFSVRTQIKGIEYTEQSSEDGKTGYKWKTAGN